MIIDGRRTGFPIRRTTFWMHCAILPTSINLAIMIFRFRRGELGFCRLSLPIAAIPFVSETSPMIWICHLVSSCWGICWWVFDHYTDLLYLIGLNYHEHEIDLSAAVDQLVTDIEDLNFNWLQPDTARYDCAWEPDSGRTEYMHMVERLREEIECGNLLQAVPSRRVIVQTAIPAIVAYRRLRRINPSPYLFFLDFGEWQLFGASPEMHVQVKHGQVCIRPIAGTRRRGLTREEDRALMQELCNDEKEQAEHRMLVDLARNDIGRVCVPGTVAVGDYMVVEHYARVMHLVSEIKGRLEDGKSGIDAIRATFPAGTVSGAPKIRAIETIDALEPVARRFYAGLVGYIEPGGDVDSCIVIRSAYKRGDSLIAQVGGGVVYDSIPEREYEETCEKLAALVDAIVEIQSYDPNHR